MENTVTIRQYLFGVEIEADVVYRIKKGMPGCFDCWKTGPTPDDGDELSEELTVKELRVYGNVWDCETIRKEIEESEDLAHHVTVELERERERSLR